MDSSIGTRSTKWASESDKIKGLVLPVILDINNETRALTNTTRNIDTNMSR